MADGDKKRPGEKGFTPPPGTAKPDTGQESLGALGDAMSDPLFSIVNPQQRSGGGPRVRQVTTTQQYVGPQTPLQQQEFLESQAGIQQAEELQYQAPQRIRDIELQRDIDVEGIRMDHEEATKQRYADYQHGRQLLENTARESDDLRQRLKTQLDQQTKDLSLDAYWSKKGSGAKVAAALAIAFGAMGQAMIGGPNRGLEIIQQTIAQELDLQKKRLEVSRSELNNQRNVVAQAYKELGDYDAAYAQANAVYQQRVLEMIEQRQKVATSDIQQQQFMMTHGLQSEKAERANREAMMKRHGLKETTVTRASGGRRKQPDVVEMIDRYKKARELLGLGAPVDISGIPLANNIKDPNKRKAYEDAFAAAVEVGAGIEAMRKFREKHGAEFMANVPGGHILSATAQEAKTKHAFTSMQIARLFEKGRMSDDDRKFYKGLTRNPGSVGEVLPGYKSADEKLMATVAAAAKKANLPIDQVVRLVQQQRDVAMQTIDNLGMPAGAEPVK